MEDDALLSAVFGGVPVGVEVRLLFRSRASTRGPDVLAMTICKYNHMPICQLMIIIDSIVLPGGGFKCLKEKPED